MDDLLKRSAEELLEKFGKGEHIPGSGSAAAFQGMLAGQLIKTVINLTSDERYSKYYQESIIELGRINTDITARIYPELSRLFLLDSQQFDKAIKLRRLRDEENDPFKKGQYHREALNALMPATETPIQIAWLCAELAEYGIFTFGNAFRAARGDSSVAFRGAIAAIDGCISIVGLNLLWFGYDEWVSGIRAKVRGLKTTYAELSAKADACVNELLAEGERNILLHKEVNLLLSRIETLPRLTDNHLEQTAKALQNILWEFKDVIWKRPPSEHKEILKPKNALMLLGYRVESINVAETYDMDGRTMVVAGIIDKPNKTVAVSRALGNQVEKFTTAHELGHALFHQQKVLHRERPLDGPEQKEERPIEERQADKFASYFLMPEKIVRSAFKSLFGKENFILDADTTFALTFGKTMKESDFKNALRSDPFILARFVADMKLPAKEGGVPTSLAEIFGVSVEAMAIRLKELGIVDF